MMGFKDVLFLTLFALFCIVPAYVAITNADPHLDVHIRQCFRGVEPTHLYTQPPHRETESDSYVLYKTQMPLVLKVYFMCVYWFGCWLRWLRHFYRLMIWLWNWIFLGSSHVTPRFALVIAPLFEEWAKMLYPILLWPF